jgi:hypothetical protein
MTVVVDGKVDLSSDSLDKLMKNIEDVFDRKRIQRLKNNSVKWGDGRWYVYAGATEQDAGEIMFDLNRLFTLTKLSFNPALSIASGTDRDGRSVDAQVRYMLFNDIHDEIEEFYPCKVLLTERAATLLIPLISVKSSGPLAWIVEHMQPKYVRDNSTGEGFFSYSVELACSKDEEDLEKLLFLLGMEKGEEAWWPACFEKGESVGYVSKEHYDNHRMRVGGKDDQ